MGSDTLPTSKKRKTGFLLSPQRDRSSNLCGRLPLLPLSVHSALVGPAELPLGRADDFCPSTKRLVSESRGEVLESL